MNPEKLMEDLLRESSAYGNEKAIKAFLNSGVNINSQNSTNGWTALHWASKRGHASIVRLLLSKGANPSLVSVYGETALSLAANEEICQCFPGSSTFSSEPVEKKTLPITPNYISSPVLAPEIDPSSQLITSSVGTSYSQNRENELVLKVRVADIRDKDFIEIEVPLNELSYEKVFETCCSELGVETNTVLKLRKLPNTIMRRDKDVFRLQNYQELELVLKTSIAGLQTLTTENIQPLPRAIPKRYRSLSKEIETFLKRKHLMKIHRNAEDK